MPRIFVLFAGLPSDILGPFISRLKQGYGNLQVLETLPLGSAFYTAQYAENLYRMVACSLRKVVGEESRTPWNLSFIVFYVRKPDGSERFVVERFDMEALLAPLVLAGRPRKAPKRHLIRVAINELVRQTTQLLRNVRGILNSVAQQVTNRDTRTCLLLPRANYGAEFEKVKECVHGAIANFDSPETFDGELKALAARLPKNSDGRFRSGQLVFRAPSKAGARHGSAPLWDTDEHNDRCVIRGRVRFGAPYDPKFHYDCDLTPNSGRQFVSCHGKQTLKRGRSHVNIAPNDNIR